MHWRTKAVYLPLPVPPGGSFFGTAQKRDNPDDDNFAQISHFLNSAYVNLPNALRIRVST